MSRKAIIAVLVVSLGAALAVTAWSLSPPDHSSRYIVEMIPADSDAPGDVVDFGNLSGPQQEQFKRSISTERTYDSRPAIVEYAGDIVVYDGTRYTVLVAVH